MEIHEIDITDGLNRELYNKLKQENSELLKKIDELERENTSMEETIRELIKENTELSTKTLQLEQKLDIAVKALEWYDGLENLLVGWELATGQPKGKAREALDKIMELK